MRILPISEKYLDYAAEVESELKAVGIRVSIDQHDEKIGAKIRLAQLAKVSYMLVIGEREQESKQISIRHRDRGDEGTLDVSAFRERVVEEIQSRAL